MRAEIVVDDELMTPYAAECLLDNVTLNNVDFFGLERVPELVVGLQTLEFAVVEGNELHQRPPPLRTSASHLSNRLRRSIKTGGPTMIGP